MISFYGLIGKSFNGKIILCNLDEVCRCKMEKTLIKEKKYSGCYVTLKDFNDSTVIADGKDPKEVYETALKKGYSEPVIIYVPIAGTVQIY